MKLNVAGQLAPAASLVLIADGSEVTSGASCYVNGTAADLAGGGVLTYAAHIGWQYAPTQAETNHYPIVFRYEAAGAIPVTMTVYPTFPQSGDNFARLGAPAGASISADVATVLAKVLDAAASRAALGMGSANMDTQLSGIAAKTTNLPADPASNTYVGSVGTSLAAAIAEIPAAVLAAAATNGLTMAQMFKVTEAAVSGIVKNAGTTNEEFWDPTGAKRRYTVTVDASGNRTGVTFDDLT